MARDLDDDRVAAPLLGHELLLGRAAACTRLTSAFSRSTLVTATTIGTSAARAWLIASTVCGITPSSAATTSTTMSVASAPRARMAVNASWPGVSMKVIGRSFLTTWYAPMCWVMPPASPATTFAERMRVEQRGLAVVDVTHDGDDRRARLEQRLVLLVVVVAEHRLQLELGLLTGLDEQDLRAELLGDELDHLVGERLRAGDHLARVEQDADEVGAGAVQLGRELLDRDAARARRSRLRGRARRPA